MWNVIAIICMVAMPMIIGFAVGYYRGRERIIEDYELRNITKGDLKNAISVVRNGYWQH